MSFFKKILILCGMVLSVTTSAKANPVLPLMGEVSVEVIPCLFTGANPPHSDLDTYSREVQKAADIFNDQSHGAFRLVAKLRPTVQINRSYTQARQDRVGARTIAQECLDAAGSGTSANSIRHVLTIPGFGANGLSDLGAYIYGGTSDGKDRLASDLSNLSFSKGVNGAYSGGLVHEMGHAFNLPHTVGTANDITALLAPTEYGSKFAIMGKNGPYLSAYNRMLLGAMPRTRLTVIGLAEGGCDNPFRYPNACEKTITLHDASRLISRSSRGSMIALLPYDSTDPESYILVEWHAGNEEVGGSRTKPSLLIYAVQETDQYYDDWNKSHLNQRDGGNARKPALLYRWQNFDNVWSPLQELKSGQVRVELARETTASFQRSAQVKLRSFVPFMCESGFVHRKAFDGDRICVTLERRKEVEAENAAAPTRLANGRCPSGFRARSIRDNVCVTREASRKAESEYAARFNWTSPQLAHRARGGPHTCADGFVFREANDMDWVCTTPARLAEIRRENRQAPMNTQPNGSCKQGFVWREATMTDRTCVTPASRSIAKAETDSRAKRYRYR